MFLEYIGEDYNMHLISLDLICYIHQSEREDFDYFSYADIETGDGIIETRNTYKHLVEKLKEAELIV